jgi:hypothetical protein
VVVVLRLLCLVMSCVCRVRVLYLLLSINGMIRRSPACSRKRKRKKTVVSGIQVRVSFL